MCVRAPVKHMDSERVSAFWLVGKRRVDFNAINTLTHTRLSSYSDRRPYTHWYPPNFIVKMLCYRTFILTLFTQWVFYCWLRCCFCKRLGPADSRKITSYIHVQSANLIKKEFIKAAEVSARCFCFFSFFIRSKVSSMKQNMDNKFRNHRLFTYTLVLLRNIQHTDIYGVPLPFESQTTRMRGTKCLRNFVFCWMLEEHLNKINFNRSTSSVRPVLLGTKGMNGLTHTRSRPQELKFLSWIALQANERVSVGRCRRRRHCRCRMFVRSCMNVRVCLCCVRV